MSRVSDRQIEMMRDMEALLSEPVNDDDWNIRELKTMISEYETKPGYEEITGTLLRAKVLLEMKSGF